MRASEKYEDKLQSTETIKVLIADDDPPTRILLRAAISQWGYEVVEASNGEEAWEILQQSNPPRLLILDWLMPKLDGIALCARIKQQHAFHPYTILLTQVTGTTNIIKGLESGADEFLSKPFNMAELRSRLSVGARIINYENALAIQNKKMEEYASRMEAIAKAHAKQLVYHSDLLGMLGSLVKGISQEIYDTLINIHNDLKVTPSKPLSTSQLQKIEELQLSLEHIIDVIKRLQVDSIRSNKASSCQINDIIQKTLDTCQNAFQHIKLELDLAKNLPILSMNRDQLQEVFLSLILSAATALKNQANAYLCIKTLSLDHKTIRIVFEDSGPSIPDKELKIMLQPLLVSNDHDQMRSRLGAAMSKEIIQKCGGKLSLENRYEGGTRFTIDLPVQQEKTRE